MIRGHSSPTSKYVPIVILAGLATLLVQSLVTNPVETLIRVALGLLVVLVASQLMQYRRGMHA